MADIERSNRTTAEPLRVLVTGATGKQGGGLARLLAQGGHRVRGLTRKPEGTPANTLRQAGIELYSGNMEDPDSVKRAASGCDVAYIMATPFDKGPEYETTIATTAMDAVRAAGVPYIVYSSVSDADRHTGIPHFESKANAERHLQAMGVDYAIVAPVYFMENLMAPWTTGGLAQGVLAMGLPENRKLQAVALRDIAAFSAVAVEQRNALRGKRINIAGDELAPREMARQLSEVMGRAIRYQPLPIEQLRSQNDDFAKMFEWFNRVGYSADIPRLRKEYPSVGWQTFRAWAESQDWKKILSSPGPSPR